jgi:NADPH2:quinone reductase
MTMKAVGLKDYLPIDDDDSLLDEEVEKPLPQRRDLLVEIKAVSVNPVDTKQRAPKDQKEEKLRILGYDASGIVTAVGEDCVLFNVGDEVYYAGDVTRQGSNAEYQLVDEQLVGRKPATLSFAEAAAMPLTSITAWESLYDRMKLTEQDAGKSLLIIGGAGGVGSIAIQLAARAGLEVIATASRQETIEWCNNMGAHYTINHREELYPQLKKLGYDEVDYVLCLADTNEHWEGMAACIKPQGTICAIVENSEPIDMTKIRSKSVTFCWEFMFTRAIFKTEDRFEQHRLLTKMADMFDQGELRQTMTKTLSPINAETLKEAHRLLEKGNMIGKLVIQWSRV